MKKVRVIIALAVVLGLGMASCTQQTCPTYSKEIKKENKKVQNS